MNEMLDLYEEVDENEDCPFTIHDLKNLAKSYLDLFFMDKAGMDGKPIPKELLHSERNVSHVLNLNICENMPVIYEGMEELFSNQKRKGKVSSDIEFIMEQLSSCAKRCIPKPFATGVIVVYLEMCLGCRINI